MKRLWMKLWLHLNQICPTHGMFKTRGYCDTCIENEQRKFLEKKKKYLEALKCK